MTITIQNSPRHLEIVLETGYDRLGLVRSIYFWYTGSITWRLAYWLIEKHSESEILPLFLNN